VKRPVSTEAVERLVDRVERGLQESGHREVTSELIGRRVLDDLSEIDALAAVRFASVFRNFSSPSDYEAFFAEIESHADAVNAADASRDESGQDDPNDKVRPLRARG